MSQFLKGMQQDFVMCVALEEMNGMLIMELNELFHLRLHLDDNLEYQDRHLHVQHRLNVRLRKTQNNNEE